MTRVLWALAALVLVALGGFEIAWSAMGFVWFGFRPLTIIVAPIGILFGLVALFVAHQVVTNEVLERSY